MTDEPADPDPVDRERVDHELRQLAGSRRLAEELRRNLETLRDHGGDSPLAAMARDILQGRLSLREVTRTAAFADPLTEAMDHFHEYDSRLNPDERTRLIYEAQDRLADEGS